MLGDLGGEGTGVRNAPIIPSYTNLPEYSTDRVTYFGTLTDASGFQSMNLHNNYRLSISKTCTHVLWRLILLVMVTELSGVQFGL